MPAHQPGPCAKQRERDDHHEQLDRSVLFRRLKSVANPSTRRVRSAIASKPARRAREQALSEGLEAIRLRNAFAGMSFNLSRRDPQPESS